MPNIVDDDDDVLLPDDFVDDSDDLSAPVAAKDDAESKPESPETGKESEVAKASDDETPDQESYSKRVQKRINKLTDKVRKFEQETNFWKERVTALEDKASAREFSDFQQQVAYSEAQLAASYQDTQAAYKRAKEEGDIEGEMKAHDKMLDLRDQLAEKRRLSQAAKEQAEKFQQPEKPQPQQPPRESAAEVPADLPDGTQQWLKANPWFMKGADPTAAKFARELDAALQEEGYTPDDPAMYSELDKRLRAVVPRVATLVKESPTTPAKSLPKARVAGSSADGQRTGTPGTAAKPARVLTHSDLDSMRKFNMDPRNPSHRKAWLHRNDPL
jgi:hypothetical protein